MINNDTLGIYIHIPFCVRKCLYCDFYSVVPTDDIKKRYITSLCEEIKKWGEHTACPIDTLYIGGGTPSVLEKDELSAIFTAVRESFKLLPDAEITVEINPGDNTESFLKYATELGVNRISIGVQSFCDNELCRLGRRHTSDDAAKAVKAARECGINNISADIMIGLPDSTTDSLNKSINGILSLNTEHISAYILKLEDGTPFARTSLNLPDDDKVAEQYLELCRRFREAGYNHYEISNFAKRGYQSRHNNRYWKQEEYIGIGPSAHSFFEGKRFFYERNIDTFINSAETTFDSYGGDEAEYIMLALRLSRGLILKEFECKFGKSVEPRLIAKAKTFEKHGLCVYNGDSLSLSDEGMLVSNTIISEFLGEIYENF